MEGEVAVDRIHQQQTYRAAHPMRLEEKKEGWMGRESGAFDAPGKEESERRKGSRNDAREMHEEKAQICARRERCKKPTTDDLNKSQTVQRRP